MANSRSTEERLGSCPGAEGIHHSFSCYNKLVCVGDLSSHKLAIDNFKITLVVVAPTATRDRADIYECLAEWDHLQVLVSVAGRRCHWGEPSQRKTLLAIGWLGQADSGCHGLAVLFGFNRHKAHLVRSFLPFLGQLDASQFPPNPPEFPHRMLTLLGEGSIRQFGGRSGAPSLFRISIPLKFGLAPMSER